MKTLAFVICIGFSLCLGQGCSTVGRGKSTDSLEKTLAHINPQDIASIRFCAWYYQGESKIEKCPGLVIHDMSFVVRDQQVIESILSRSSGIIYGQEYIPMCGYLTMIELRRWDGKVLVGIDISCDGNTIVLRPGGRHWGVDEMTIGRSREFSWYIFRLMNQLNPNEMLARKKIYERDKPHLLGDFPYNEVGS